MVMHRLIVEEYKQVPILADESTCSGRTYIITGSGSGLGLETARHLVKFMASCVVLAVQDMNAGENARREIERSTGRKGVVQIWHLDMASSASVRSFARKASEDLKRVDGLVINSGVLVDAWSTAEGTETSITVSVINTLLLGALMMPKLRDSGRNSATRPTLVFIVSALGYTAKAEMDKSREGGIFAGLNDPKRADMKQRYALAKLVEECAARQLSALCPVRRTGVVINMVAPDFFPTGTDREARTFTKIMHEAIRVMVAQSAEVRSRSVLHGLTAGEESHGKLLSGCAIRENCVPDWLSNVQGQILQRAIWDELAARLEKLQLGCISKLSSR